MSATVEDCVNRIRAHYPDARIEVQECWIVRGFQQPVGCVDARLVEGEKRAVK